MKRTKVAQLYRRLRGRKHSPAQTTGSVFLGLFVGLLPLYGLHLPLCLGLALPLKLDGLIAYAAANISNPFLAPFILLTEIEAGSLLFNGHLAKPSVAALKQQSLSALTGQTLVGALVVAFVGATLGAILTAAVASLFRQGARTTLTLRRRALQRRLLTRYQSVRPQDRHYVRVKLATDPLTERLHALDDGLGAVTDVGCGRGQFGLLLRILGKAKSLYGFDWDEKKVRSAQQAGQDLGHFVVANLEAPPLFATDTFLLFDVLHYLSRDEQHKLLSLLFTHLSPGGRLLLRDIGHNRGFASVLTRTFEHVGTALRMNRGKSLHFKNATETLKDAEAVGFVVESTSRASGALLDNQLIVLRKPLVTPQPT